MTQFLLIYIPLVACIVSTYFLGRRDGIAQGAAYRREAAEKHRRELAQAIIRASYRATNMSKLAQMAIAHRLN